MNTDNPMTTDDVSVMLQRMAKVVKALRPHNVDIFIANVQGYGGSDGLRVYEPIIQIAPPSDEERLVVLGGGLCFVSKITPRSIKRYIYVHDVEVSWYLEVEP